jgi:hypothetical protein
MVRTHPTRPAPRRRWIGRISRRRAGSRASNGGTGRERPGRRVGRRYRAPPTASGGAGVGPGPAASRLAKIAQRQIGSWMAGHPGLRVGCGAVAALATAAEQIGASGECRASAMPAITDACRPTGSQPYSSSEAATSQPTRRRADVISASAARTGSHSRSSAPKLRSGLSSGTALPSGLAAGPAARGRKRPRPRPARSSP